MEKIPPLQTISEEVFNSITHGIGLGLSIAALCLMVVTASETGNPWHIVSAAIFGSSLIILYMSSTIYHSVQHPGIKRVFRTLDHISIYILIAGSYTPISIGLLRGGLGWTLFGLEWGFALIGIFFKIFFGHKLEALSTTGYVIMGWLILMAFYPVISMVETGGIIFLVAGGVAYTIGVPFYFMDEKYKYFHSIWHLFVLAGSICHFFAIQLYLIS
ncbi:MAG: hemolysin III family protein [Desulfobacterales bacterium]|nr:hemolysin III family protein [Desulfobacterales bacterium]MCP4161446.1 hemolysin III family protein [Deltaproteobacteria bacterium]